MPQVNGNLTPHPSEAISVGRHFSTVLLRHPINFLPVVSTAGPDFVMSCVAIPSLFPSIGVYDQQRGVPSSTTHLSNLPELHLLFPGYLSVLSCIPFRVMESLNTHNYFSYSNDIL